MHHRILFTAFLLLAFCTSQTTSAATSGNEPHTTWATRINSLLQQDLFKHSQVAIYVYDLTDERLVMEHNAQQLMRPASTQKLITAIAALDKLGSKYRYATSLHAVGNQEDSIYVGDLFVKAGFDPLFGKTDLCAFVESIATQGIRRIRGNLWLDVSIKDTLSKGWGWCWDDDEKPLSPLCYLDGDNFTQAFVDKLYEAGITLEGGYGYTQLPDSATLLCKRTHSINEVMKKMMKKSDNHHAESMFYQLAAHSGKPFATHKDAAKAINAMIKDFGLNPADYKIADGSGLSLYNYTTAELLGRFLRHAYKKKNIYNALKPSLPIAGVDGTLERRLQKTSAARRVWAKTGSVTAISTLAGYIQAEGGHMLCFVIFNQGLVKAKIGREFQDAVCKVLTSQAEGKSKK